MIDFCFHFAAPILSTYPHPEWDMRIIALVVLAALGVSNEHKHIVCSSTNSVWLRVPSKYQTFVFRMDFRFRLLLSLVFSPNVTNCFFQSCPSFCCLVFYAKNFFAFFLCQYNNDKMKFAIYAFKHQANCVVPPSLSSLLHCFVLLFLTFPFWQAFRSFFHFIRFVLHLTSASFKTSSHFPHFIS